MDGLPTLPLEVYDPTKNDPTPEDLLRLTAGDKLALAAAMAEAASRGLLPDGKRLSRLIGPKTDDELLQAIQDLTGYRIPRVAVCVEHGHTAPAQTFCDLYFERIRNVLWIGNRGGGKTSNSGMLHGAKARYNDAYSSAIAGAVARQGIRAYAEFQRFTRRLGNEVLKSIMSRTEWANGSLTEVLGGTVAQLNGPHPHLAQMDEAELTTPEPFQEFLNMAQGDARYRAQQLLTSTRKKAHGLVHKLVRESEDAVRRGVEPPWYVRIFCVFETMQNVPHCRTAPENAHRPDEELCQCHRVQKGQWGENPPRPELRGRIRSFADVCNGRAYRSDGFVALEDVQTRFTQLSRMTWEAQQECLRPSVEGVVHKWVNERTYLPLWLPRSEFGPIYRGWDWGGQNPHAVVWVQVLAVDVGLDVEGVPITDEEQEPHRVIPAGTYVQFDEHYGNREKLGEFSQLGLHVIMRQLQWAQYGYAFAVAGDFCDPAGLVAKGEVKRAIRQFAEALFKGQLTDEHAEMLAEYELNAEHVSGQDVLELVPDFKSIPAPRYESIAKHIELGEDGRILLVEALCPNTSDEYDTYHWLEPKPGKNLPEDAEKEDDHTMDAKRYLIWNLFKLGNRPPGDQPGAQDKPAPTPGRVQSGPFDRPRTEPADTSVPEISVDDGMPEYLRGTPVGGHTSPRRFVGPTVRR